MNAARSLEFAPEDIVSTSKVPSNALAQLVTNSLLMEEVAKVGNDDSVVDFVMFIKGKKAL